MISRRILATVVVLCTLIAPAHGQKTKAELNTEIGTSFPDSNPITPSNLRNVASDIVNSIMPTAPVASGNLSCFSGTTGLLQDCGRSITLNDVKLGPNSSTLPHPPVGVGEFPIDEAQIVEKSGPIESSRWPCSVRSWNWNRENRGKF